MKLSDEGSPQFRPLTYNKTIQPTSQKLLIGLIILLFSIDVVSALNIIDPVVVGGTKFEIRVYTKLFLCGAFIFTSVFQFIKKRNAGADIFNYSMEKTDNVEQEKFINISLRKLFFISMITSIGALVSLYLVITSGINSVMQYRYPSFLIEDCVSVLLFMSFSLLPFIAVAIGKRGVRL